MKEFYLGASYYPEWWSPERWEDDFSKMEELGFNIVRMGEFAWSWYEPEEGKYNFEPMRQAIECAEKHGISVILGTPTAVCPSWLYKKCPDIKGGNTNGHYDFGGRKGQCLSNEVFLDYAKKICEEQAKALGNCKNLIGWQLDNEPGFPFWDFDENCNIGFRKWLKEKYVTIDKLNEAWFTMMWSNVYNDFDEIMIPVNAAEGGWTPEIQLDYRKYFSFTFNRLLRMEAEIVRKYSPDRFIYTNWPGANWSVNCFEGSEYLDYAAWDNYVGQPNGENYRIQFRASLEHSFDRRLSNGKNCFLVAEQSSTHDANTLPEVMAAQTWLNISHGAFGTIFFEWCSPKGGFEQGGNHILGKDRQIRKDIGPVLKKLSSDIKEFYPLIADGETKSQIAIIYSYENSWASPGWIVDGPYDEEIFNAYGGFRNQAKNNIDVISVDDDFKGYRLIIIPNLRIVTEEQAEKIKEFVRNGGTVVLNTECGTREISNQMREMVEPGLFADMCGATVCGEISAARLEEQTCRTPTIRYTDGKEAKPSGVLHVIDCDTARPLASYNDGHLYGKCAVSINQYGKGNAILYSSTENSMQFFESLASFAVKEAYVQQIMIADDGIILSTRIKDGKKYIFAVNMKDKDLTLVPEKEFTVLNTGKKTMEKITVPAYGTVILS